MYRVLHRHVTPRHPPGALICFLLAIWRGRCSSSHNTLPCCLLCICSVVVKLRVSHFSQETSGIFECRLLHLPPSLPTAQMGKGGTMYSLP